MAETSSPTLTETLLLALSQNQKQIQTIQRQALRIEELQRENEVLRKELDEGKHDDNVQGDEASATSMRAQDIFQDNIDAQAEIKRLHKRLKAYKEKVNERLSMPLSSPVVPSPITLPLPTLSSYENPQSAGLPDASQMKKRALSQSSPPRKRLKSGLRNPEVAPSELSANSVDSANLSRDPPKTLDAGQDIMTEEIATGRSGDITPACFDSANLKRDDGRKSEIHDRLDALLVTPRIVKSPLSRPKASTPRSSHAHPLERVSFDDMNGDIQSRPPQKQSGKSTVPADEMFCPIPLTFEKSIRCEEVTKLFERSSSGEPLRRRPLQDLSLHHFKLNPQALLTSRRVTDNTASDGYAERIHARQKMGTIQFGDSGFELSINDYEELLGFLGAGSEAQILGLSSSARNELLSKARRAQAAKALTPWQIASGIHDDPPGFWSADMPGTQENINNKLTAKENERKEVELRCYDATTNREKWIFADE